MRHEYGYYDLAKFLRDCPACGSDLVERADNSDLFAHLTECGITNTSGTWCACGWAVDNSTLEDLNRHYRTIEHDWPTLLTIQKMKDF